jgi:hypothetical protein
MEKSKIDDKISLPENMFTEHFCIAAGEHLYSEHLFNIFGF